MIVAVPGSKFVKLRACHSGSGFRTKYMSWPQEIQDGISHDGSSTMGKHGDKYEIGPDSSPSADPKHVCGDLP